MKLLRSHGLVCIALIVALLAAPLHATETPDTGAAEAAAMSGMGMDCDMGQDTRACPDCVNCIAGIVSPSGAVPSALHHSPSSAGFPNKSGYPRHELRPPKPVFL